MRENRGVRAVLAVLLVSASVLGLFSAPVAAEFDSTKRSTYGVATKGNSNTIAAWDALTWEYEQVGNTILVGGNYLDIVNGVNSIVGRQPYIAAFEADTGRWESWWRPDVGGAVFAMEPSPDGAMFVGGEMATWNGQAIGALAKIDPLTGELWPSFDGRVFGASSVVRDIKLEADGWLYVVGNFDTASVGGVPVTRNGAVRINPLTGAIDPTWAPDVTGGAIWGVSRSKTLDRTYFAGHFTKVNGGDNTAGFVSVDDSGQVVDTRDYVPFNGCGDTGWNFTDPNYCNEMFDVLATAAGDVWVGGVEHALYVLEEGGVMDPNRPKYTPPSYMKWFHYAGCDPTLPRNQAPNPTCIPNDWSGGDFQELELVGDRVYATCHCWFDLSSSDSQIMPHALKGSWIGTEGVDYFQAEINAVMAFDAASGEHIPAFYPLLGGDAGGFGIHQNQSDGCLWVAGGIDSYGPPGGPNLIANDVVRLCDSTGPGQPATPDGVPPVVPICSATITGLDAAITWTIPTGAERVIVERNVNGNGWFNRGGVDAPANTFSEQIPAGSSTLYRVKARYEADQLSDYTDCPADGQDFSPPVVTYPIPTVFVDSGSPQSVGGTVTDAGSGVDRVEIVAIDLGAAGATGVTGLQAWTALDSWAQVSDAPILAADVVGDAWSFTWDPVPGGSGSYVIGIRAFDNAGNKWPANKDWQALVAISDTSSPALTAAAPEVAGNNITWSGTASDDVAVRKVRLIVRDVAANEYWNGTNWISAAQAASDPSVLLHADLSSPLSPSTNWSYVLNTTRTGTFQTLHWSQNGAYSYSTSTPGTTVK